MILFWLWCCEVLFGIFYISVEYLFVLRFRRRRRYWRVRMRVRLRLRLRFNAIPAGVSVWKEADQVPAAAFYSLRWTSCNYFELSKSARTQMQSVVGGQKRQKSNPSQQQQQQKQPPQQQASRQAGSSSSRGQEQRARAESREEWSSGLKGAVK